MTSNVFGKICRYNGTLNECHLDEIKDSFDPFEDSNLTLVQVFQILKMKFKYKGKYYDQGENIIIV